VKLSLSDRFILRAIELGYSADREGNMYLPSGELAKTTPKKSGHLSHTLYLDGLNSRGYQAVLVHRFVAAYFLGEDALKAQCIRHLNDVPTDNRLDNLAPGSFKENRADIPRETLSRIGKERAHLLVERCRVLTDKDVLGMRALRANQGLPYHKIASIYGVSTMTAYRAVTKQSWKEV